MNHTFIVKDLLSIQTKHLPTSKEGYEPTSRCGCQTFSCQGPPHWHKLENWPPFDKIFSPSVMRWMVRIETAGPPTICFTQNGPCKWFRLTPQKYTFTYILELCHLLCLPLGDVIIVKINKPPQDHCSKSLWKFKLFWVERLQWAGESSCSCV